MKSTFPSINKSPKSQTRFIFSAFMNLKLSSYKAQIPNASNGLLFREPYLEPLQCTNSATWWWLGVWIYGCLVQSFNIVELRWLQLMILMTTEKTACSPKKSMILDEASYWWYILPWQFTAFWIRPPINQIESMSIFPNFTCWNKNKE